MFATGTGKKFGKQRKCLNNDLFSHIPCQSEWCILWQFDDPVKCCQRQSKIIFCSKLWHSYFCRHKKWFGMALSQACHCNVSAFTKLKISLSSALLTYLILWLIHLHEKKKILLSMVCCSFDFLDAYFICLWSYLHFVFCSSQVSQMDEASFIVLLNEFKQTRCGLHFCCQKRTDVSTHSN